jgi:hypothetical protein
MRAGFEVERTIRDSVKGGWKLQPPSSFRNDTFSDFRQLTSLRSVIDCLHAKQKEADETEEIRC